MIYDGSETGDMRRGCVRSTGVIIFSVSPHGPGSDDHSDNWTLGRLVKLRRGRSTAGGFW